MSTTQLYLLITLLPNLRELCIIGSVGLGIALVFGTIFYVSEESEYSMMSDLAKKITKFLLVTAAICWPFFVVGSIIIPDTKQLAMIYSGAYISNNEQITGLPPKLLDLVHKYLDEKLNDK